MSKHEDLAKAIVELIIDDLIERQGLGDEWELLDEEVQAEIREAWIGIALTKVAEF